MLHLIDWKIAKAALKLAESYHDELQYNESTKELWKIRNFHEVISKTGLDVNPEDVYEGIDRLVAKGWFKVDHKYWGGYTFNITFRSRHRWAFFLEDISRRFWGGFVLGIITGVSANLITDWFRLLLSKLFQLLSTL